MERREFIKKAGTGTAAAIAATSVGLFWGVKRKQGILLRIKK